MVYVNTWLDCDGVDALEQEHPCIVRYWRLWIRPMRIGSNNLKLLIRIQRSRADRIRIRPRLEPPMKNALRKAYLQCIVWLKFTLYTVIFKKGKWLIQIRIRKSGSDQIWIPINHPAYRHGIWEQNSYMLKGTGTRRLRHLYLKYLHISMGNRVLCWWGVGVTPPVLTPLQQTCG